MMIAIRTDSIVITPFLDQLPGGAIVSTVFNIFFFFFLLKVNTEKLQERGLLL